MRWQKPTSPRVPCYYSLGAFVNLMVKRRDSLVRLDSSSSVTRSIFPLAGMLQAGVIRNAMAASLLSTAICPLPATATGLLERWRELSAGLGGIALDPRIPADTRGELLALARRGGLRCPEISHLGGSGDGRPSPCSTDRNERRAARASLEQTLVAAASGEVQRVLLTPTALPLRPERPAVARAFARGEPLEHEALDEARGSVAGAALDGLASVLEPCLLRAEAQTLTLVLPWPAPWPHAFPDAAEVAALCTIFEGAPLAGCLCLDWVDVWRALRPEREPPRSAGPRLACLRVADACGLSQRLPLGTGEGSWREQLDALGASVDGVDRVLTFRPETRPEDVERSLALLEQSGPRP